MDQSRSCSELLHGMGHQLCGWSVKYLGSSGVQKLYDFETYVKTTFICQQGGEFMVLEGNAGKIWQAYSMQETDIMGQTWSEPMISMDGEFVFQQSLGGKGTCCMKFPRFQRGRKQLQHTPASLWEACNSEKGQFKENFESIVGPLRK